VEKKQTNGMKLAKKNCEKNNAEHAERMAHFAIENSPMVINKWNSDLQLIETNGEVVERYGFKSREDFIARFFEASPKFQPCGTLSSVKAREFLKKGFELGNLSFEWMHQHLNGTPIPSEIHFIRYDDPMDGKRYLYAYNIDISRLKESMRKETETHLRNLTMFDNCPIFMEYWDENGVLIDCNKVTLETFGFKTKESYLDDVNSIFEPTQIDGSNSEEYLKQNIKMAINKGYHRFEFRCRKFDGESVIVDVEAVHIRQENKDFVITYGTNITTLQENLELLVETEERANMMLQGVPIACFLADHNLRATDCNKAALDLSNRTTKEEAMEVFNKIVEAMDTDVIKEYLQKTMEKGTHSFRTEVVVDTEFRIPVEIASVHFHHRKQDLFALYIKDLRIINKMVEEMRRAEIAEENSQAKSRFLARMSHEIRTPITAVLGISEINLKSKVLPLDVINDFTSIYSASRALLSIVNDILDLSRIEAGKMHVSNEKYQMASLISDTINLNLFHLDKKGLDFCVRIDPNLPAYIIGDEVRLKQIYNNLLTNAFKYTDKGSVKLSVESYPIDDEQEMIVMTLEDTGQGMTKEQLDALSDEYIRFNEKKNRFVEGTGIGIQIVRGLLEIIGGTMDMSSEPGIGTKITVRIPQGIASEEVLGTEIAESIQKLEYISHSFSKRLSFEPEPMPYGSALIVDDVETNLYVTKGLLEMYQIDVETCSCGYEAIAKIENGNVYDIIFMDHMMPGIDGMETMHIIRQKGYDAPIVALTANALVGQAQEFLESGFDGFVAKPIEMANLDEILNKFIKDKQSEATIKAARLQSKSNKINREVLDFFANPKDSDSEFAKKLRRDFVRDQKNVRINIQKALEANDFKTVHRLAHTIKGAAGLIGEKKLEKLAEKVELLFKDNTKNKLLRKEMQEMFDELDSVVSQVDLTESTVNIQKVEKEKILPILTTLETKLKERSMDSIELIEKLRGIPEAVVLIRQAEQLDFAPALVTLEVLKDVIGEY